MSRDYLPSPPPLPPGEAYEGRYSAEDMIKYARAYGLFCIERVRNPLLALVDAQAEDDGLWFMAEHATEAYLQRALRHLHDAIERGP
jgi:hypothetical protein